MIKVCHMTSAHQPEDVRIFHKECTSLAVAGYEVYLVARGDSYEKNGVHIIGIGQPSGGRLSRMTGFAKTVYQKALEIDADIYHFHDPELLPYGLKLKQKGKKVIFDSHEDTLESILEKEWIPSPLRKIMYHWFANEQKTVCQKLDAVITVTPHMTEFFKQMNPSVVQIANYPIVTEAILAPSFSEKRVIFAGGISKQWNHHRIVHALDQIPDCRYRLCGSGSSEYLQELQAIPGWKQVDFLGKILHAQVATELANSWIGLAVLSPNRNTDWKNGSMGNTKIFEEMMAGLPVICTDFVLWKEFVARYQCGICIDSEKEEELVNAIRYLLDHPEEAKRMGENGRRAVKEEFNWSVEEKKLLALYEELTKEIVK